MPKRQTIWGCKLLRRFVRRWYRVELPSCCDSCHSEMQARDEATRQMREDLWATRKALKELYEGILYARNEHEGIDQTTCSLCYSILAVDGGHCEDCPGAFAAHILEMVCRD